MLLGKTTGQRRIRRLEGLLKVYRKTQPESLEAAVGYHNAHCRDQQYGFGDPLYDVESLLTDLLTSLRHFAWQRHGHLSFWDHRHPDLMSTPELDDFVDDLRKFAVEHELCWESAFEWSHTHFEDELKEDQEVS